MKFNISSCLIAVAAFAAGIAVDRVVFSPVEDTAAAEGARVRNKESSSLSSRGSRSRAISSQPGRGDSDRQREESREEGADGVLGSFRRSCGRKELAPLKFLNCISFQVVNSARCR